jgi:DNA polymerase III sliding clamp (beta) subunit (PCNA family)
MKIQVAKLRNNVATLQPVVPKKTSLPILKNILFKDGAIRATNLETEVSIKIPEVGGDAFLMNHRMLSDLLKYVPGDLAITLEYANKMVKASWNGGKASYVVPDYKDYPDTALRAPASEAVLSGDALIGALVDALPYAATEDARPVLHAVAVHLDENIIQVCGADGFRACLESLKLSYPVKQTIIVPLETISILEHVWKKAPGRPGVEFSLVAQLSSARKFKLGLWQPSENDPNRTSMSIEFGNITLVSQLVSGTYPDTLALLNGMKEPTKVTFFGPDLFTAVKRLAGIAEEGSGIVKLLWDETKMTVSASSAEIGDVEAEIPVLEGSQPGRIALSKKYLLEYLTGKEGMITLGIERRDGPALFHYGSRPIVAVMPMHAVWGDEPREEPKLEEPVAEDIHEDVQEEAEPTDEAEEAADEITSSDEADLEPAYTGPPVATVERIDIGNTSTGN